MAYIETFALLDRMNSVKSRDGNSLTIEGNKVSAHSSTSGKIDINFKGIFDGVLKSDVLFEVAVKPLIEKCLGGFNSSLVLLQSSDSVISRLLFGQDCTKDNSVKKTDLVLIKRIFKAFLQGLEQGKSGRQTAASNTSKTAASNSSKTAGSALRTSGNSLSFSCFEIVNEEINDLLKIVTKPKDLMADDSRSDNKENLITKVTVDNLNFAVNVIQESWNASYWKKCSNNSGTPDSVAFFMEFYLSHSCYYVTDPAISCFQVIKMPGVEMLSQMSTAIPQENSQSLNRGLLSFQNLVHQLANESETALTSVRDSSLTLQLKDTFGGNSFTASLVVLEPTYNDVNHVLLSLSSSIANIKNFPVVNTSYSKALLDQYEDMVRTLTIKWRDKKSLNSEYDQELKRQLHDLEKTVHSLEQERVKLQMENASQQADLSDLQQKFTEQIASKTQLSSRMVLSEEQKLQMSKNTVELQLENNRMKQDMEKLHFDLKEKSSSLQENLKTVERHLAVERRRTHDLQEEKELLKKELKELTNEYVNLKFNHTALSDAYEKQMAERESLLSEIDHLMASKEDLLRGRDCSEIKSLQRFREHLKSITEKTIMSSRDAEASTRQNPDLQVAVDFEKQLLLSKQEREERLQSMRLLHNKDLEDFEKRIDEISSRLKESEETNHLYKLKISEMNGGKIVLEDKVNYLKSVNQDQQSKIDLISTEYRKRLEEYIGDVKGYLDRETNNGQKNDNFINTLGKMLDDLRKGYQSQFEELELRLKTLCAHAEDIYKGKENILAAYKILLWKFDEQQQRGFNIDNIDLPLPPDSEVKMAQAKERNDLQTNLLLSEEAIRELQTKNNLLADEIKNKDRQIKELIQGKGTERRSSASGLDIYTVQKQIREFTINTQLDLEKERAELMTRCQVSEHQLQECQQYIETYFKRYQQEITHLRKHLHRYERSQEFDMPVRHEREQRSMLPPLDRDCGRLYPR